MRGAATSREGRCAVGLLLSALGCGTAGSEPAASGGATGTAGGGHDSGGGHGGHVLDDPGSVPAPLFAGAELAQGEFGYLETAPEGYPAAAGTAQVARLDAGPTVTVAVTGLLPQTDVVLHVHSGPCAQGGGEHFRVDPADGESPPNDPRETARLHLRRHRRGRRDGAQPRPGRTPASWWCTPRSCRTTGWPARSWRDAAGRRAGRARVVGAPRAAGDRALRAGLGVRGSGRDRRSFTALKLSRSKNSSDVGVRADRPRASASASRSSRAAGSAPRSAGRPAPGAPAPP